MSLTHEKHTRHTLIGESIAFNDENADGLLVSYNDPLVITLHVYDTNVKRVGSSANILQLRVIKEMQLAN